MYRELDTVTLKSGEHATIACVQGPNKEWAPRIIPFLRHKERVTRWQIRQTLIGCTGLLESYYYIAHRHGEVISTIATWEYLGAGILGHVYTEPKHRQKGAAKAVMQCQMNDFRSRAGNAMFLGTGYDTIPYHLYKSFGFRSVEPGAGFMQYYVQSEEAFTSQCFSPGPTTVRGIGWHDWPALVTLFGCAAGSCLRMTASGTVGRMNFEGPFIDFYHELKELGISQGSVLEIADGKSVVGVVRLSPDPRFSSAVDTFDLYVHPSADGGMEKLIDTVEWPDSRKVQAYVGSDEFSKLELLHSAGFLTEGVFKGQLYSGSRLLDVTVLARNPVDTQIA